MANDLFVRRQQLSVQRLDLPADGRRLVDASTFGDSLDGAVVWLRLFLTGLRGDSRLDEKLNRCRFQLFPL